MDNIYVINLGILHPFRPLDSQDLDHSISDRKLKPLLDLTLYLPK